MARESGLTLQGGRLYQQPVKELEHYRTQPVVYTGIEISGTCRLPNIQGHMMDLTVELQEGDYQEFTVSFAENEKYHIDFRYVRSTQTIKFDRTYSGMIRDAVCQRSMKIWKALRG